MYLQKRCRAMSSAHEREGIALAFVRYSSARHETEKSRCN